jgi:hypothetical protein
MSRAAANGVKPANDRARIAKTADGGSSDTCVGRRQQRNTAEGGSCKQATRLRELGVILPMDLVDAADVQSAQLCLLDAIFDQRDELGELDDFREIGWHV